MSYEKNLEMLTLAINLLGELSSEVVFVGGATTLFYVDPELSDEIRPTDDVDCVVEVSSSTKYAKFQKQIREKGFSHDTKKHAPICRFKYKELLTLDVMPTDKKILGFSNKWYTEGILNKETRKIGKKEINIFSLPYFLATKFEAFHERGKKDPRMSRDLEDIVLIFDGLKIFTLHEIPEGPPKKYFSKIATEFLKNDLIQEAIAGFLNNSSEKIKKLNERLGLIAEYALRL